MALARAGSQRDIRAGNRQATPSGRDGKPAIIAPSMSDDEAKRRFPQGWKTLKPYLRVVEQPKLPRGSTGPASIASPAVGEVMLRPALAVRPSVA
ncbi:MAG TPA: hypothetical protein VFW75_07000 [Acetobacteraceae bacterium]|nr:hypothetical protein [Acetobacteraceae bacterium]